MYMQRYDKNIREKLHNHAVTPPPSVWSDIEQNLPADGSRSSRWMFFLGAFLGLFAIAGLFWVNTDSAHTADTVSSEISTVPASADQSDGLRDSDEEGVSETFALSDEDDQKQKTSSLNRSQLQNSSIKNNNVIDYETRDAAGAWLADQTLRYAVEDKTSITAASRSTVTPDVHDNAVSEKTGSEMLSSSYGQTSMSVQDDNESNNTPFNVDGESTLPYPGVLTTAKKSSEDITTVIRRYERPELTHLLTPELESVMPTQVDWIGKKRKRRMNSPCTYLYDQSCYEFGGPKGESHFYLEILGGPDVYNRTLTTKPQNTELIDYAQRRDASETSELSWSAMARASLVTQSGFAARTGFLYERVHERFEASRRVTMITLDTIGGVPTIDTVSGTNTVTIYNRLNYLELPFMLGYEYHQERLMVGINAGAALGLSFTQRGRILSPADDIVSVTSDDNNRFPVYGQARINLIGSISLGYKLSPRMQLIVEPNIRYRLGSVTLDSYPLEQKYMSYGVWTGVRFRL